MTCNIFFISDTHFGHKNIITFEVIKPFRPFATIEEHDEELVKRWNSVVRKGDQVWHLGDVALNRRGLEVCGRLNGLKRLVMGNHDSEPSLAYLKYFHKLYGAAVLDNMLLTHIPVSPNQFARHKDFINVHGHMHNRRVMIPGFERGSFVPDHRYHCVSCEHTNLTPLPLEELRQRIKDKL